MQVAFDAPAREWSASVQGAHTALLDALARTQSAYERMSAAAARSDRARYNAAVRDAAPGEQAARRALQSLESAG